MNSRFLGLSYRTLVALVVLLCLTNIAAGAYLFSHDHNPHKTANQYPYIDFARNFIEQKHYITNIQPLREEVFRLSDEFEQGGRHVSVYIEYLNTGANISVNPDTYVLPASLIKTPVALAVMKKVQDGEWKLDNELVLLEGDKNPLSGNEADLLADYPVGTQFTIEELLKRLLIDSDNTAYTILLRNTGDQELFRIVDALGLDALFTPDGKVSAKEYSRILRSLYTASFLNREHSQKVLEWLDESTFNEFASAAVPPEVPFPHKYGEDLQKNVFADSGIIYIENRPYIISIMVAGKTEPQFSESEQEAAKAFMHDVSEAAYEYFSRYGE